MKLIAPQDASLLELLALLGPDSSKNTLRSWLEKGRVSVDGRVVKDGRLQVRQGQQVALGPRTEFIDADIEILYEDLHLVVILKPEGLLSVATNFDKEYTAHTFLKKRHPNIVYPVHRLDRDTSGIMVFAYSEEAKDKLKRMFHDHILEREYTAIVEGKMEESSGRWRSFLAEDDFYVVKSINNPTKGKEAITHYEVLSHTKKFSLLKLKLETGRKNQIRVHCQEAGHPIVGDKKYGAVTNPIKRLCLHANKLAFRHPISSKPMKFESLIPSSFFKLIP